MKLKDIKRLYVQLTLDKVITDKNYFILITTNYLYIRYRSYGSSAIKHNLKGFIWLINTIYKDYAYDDFIVMDLDDYHKGTTVIGLGN